MERIGPVAYRLKLPAASKVHPVFHVSLLKKAVQGVTGDATLPSEIDLATVDQLLPEVVRATRSIVRQGETVQQWLIQWKGRSPEEATWEDTLVMQSQFPDAGLEDKTIFEGVSSDTHLTSPSPTSIDKPKVWKVYTRRSKAQKES